MASRRLFRRSNPPSWSRLLRSDQVQAVAAVRPARIRITTDLGALLGRRADIVALAK